MFAHRQRKLLLAHPTLADYPIKRIFLVIRRIAVMLSGAVVMVAVVVVVAVDDAIGYSRGRRRGGLRAVRLRVRMLREDLGALDG